MGICYSNGAGVAQDSSEAVNWFRKAAEQGSAQAQTMLACCYSEGRGVTKDLASAYAMLLLSRAGGDKDAMELLKELGPAMTPELLVVANHPHGALDGLAVAALLRRVRPDVKLLANQVLHRIPEMRPHLVPIDAFMPGDAQNAAGLRGALRWLRDGHALIVFPAGEVSHVRAVDGRVVDAPWREGAARLAARAEAPVLPVWVRGRNSRAFLSAGRVSPWLRSALLGRELLWQRGRTVHLTVGRLVSQRRLQAIGDAPAQTSYLRIRTYGLAAGAPDRAPLVRLASRPARPEPVADAADAATLGGEVQALPPTARLTGSGPWSVYLVGANDAPQVVQEIGRLRELTFRAAGEGTGRARDLDRFDRHYRHLFVWHGELRQVVRA
jgi:putative hemolysin